MPTRSIALTEDEDRIVDDLIRSGRFRNADEVVSEGLRLIREDDEDETFGYTPEELKAAIQVGLDDLANGRYTKFESMDECVAYLRRLSDDIISDKTAR